MVKEQTRPQVVPQPRLPPILLPTYDYEAVELPEAAPILRPTDLTDESKTGDSQTEDSRRGKVGQPTDRTQERTSFIEEELTSATFGNRAKLHRLQALLSDFASPRQAAKRAKVSHTLLYEAIGDGRLKVFKLDGGRKVVSVTQCKLLWPDGAIQGRPRKS